MRIMLMGALVLGAAAAAPAAFAAETAKPAPEAAAKADKLDPNRRVCKKTHSVGSLFPSKLCKTAREWQIEEELAQDTMRRSQREQQGGSN